MTDQTKDLLAMAETAIANLLGCQSSSYSPSNDVFAHACQTLDALRASATSAPVQTTLEQAVTEVVARHGGVRATERATGLDKSFISRLMRGSKTHPSDETLKKLGLKAVPLYVKALQ